MPTRRQFLASGLAPAALAWAPRLAPDRVEGVMARLAELERDPRSPRQLAQDDAFWFEISRAFTVDRSLVNLNNGGVSPAPRFVQEAMKGHLDFSNQAPTYTMWRILEPQREGVRKRLAHQLGCDAEEIAITRNASEGLQTCQFGMDLARGDVVLTTDQDYPRMITTFKQRERREGLVLRQFAIPTPCDEPARITALFEKNMDEHRPKLVLMSHITFTTGQILPVREVVAAARKRGIPVIVDGAHAFAHFDFKIDDLDCDYYATSLHKWLFAPHGTGMLYVRRDKIAGLWPLMAAGKNLDDNIRKFEEIGTHPAANHLAIAEALNFHQGLGSKRKQARLVHLREYWAKRLVDRYPGKVVLHTSRKPGLACGIATVQIVGVPSAKVVAWLMSKHRIIATGIKNEQFEGLRISPSVYTTHEELDRFCAAMGHVVENGLPG